VRTAETDSITGLAPASGVSRGQNMFEPHPVKIEPAGGRVGDFDQVISRRQAHRNVQVILVVDVVSAVEVGRFVL